MRLAGGVRNCLEQAEEAAEKGELKWALKMADVVLDCRHTDSASASAGDERRAREIKSRCLRALGEQGWICHSISLHKFSLWACGWIYSSHWFVTPMRIWKSVSVSNKLEWSIVNSEKC